MAVIMRGLARTGLLKAGHWLGSVWPHCQASPPAPTSQEQVASGSCDSTP